jgi:hypothetical protein
MTKVKATVNSKANIAALEAFARQVPNPNRRWWQFWRPRFVEGPSATAGRVLTIERHDPAARD